MTMGASSILKAVGYCALRGSRLILYVAVYAAVIALIGAGLASIEYAAIGRAILLFFVEVVPFAAGAAYDWATALPVFAQVVVGLLLFFIGGPLLLACIGAVFAAGEWIREKGVEVITWLTVIPALLFMREFRRARSAIGQQFQRAREA